MFQNLRNEVQWFKNNPDYVYLDSAATSLKPKSVVDAMSYYCDFISTNPHNDDSLFTHQAHIVMDETRKKLAKLLNANSDEIVFTPGATYSLNSIASFIKPFFKADDEIVLSNAEHASNLLPWYDIYDEFKQKDNPIKIQYEEIDINSDNINNFLSKINKKTKMICFANETNFIGNSIDAVKLSNEIKRINPNIFICVDSTQYLSHYKLDLKNSNIDFVVGSAHKMLGPTGIGFLYINKNLIEKLKPNIVGGGMNFEIKRNYYSLLSGLSKFEAGTPNIMGIYGWNKALDYYLNSDIDLLTKKIYELKNYLDSEMEKVEGIKIFNKGIKAFNTIFIREGIFSQDFSSYLGSQKIIVRSGLSCAKLANEIIKEDHAIRASFHFYTNKNDIDKLIYAIKKFKKGDILNGLF
ncbi:MAG: cysteine desulfurase [Malacoplasma sp.]|nr:cysteine desulfurase [Malacoplasma sp.]